MLKIHNNLSNRKEEFRPMEPGRVRMYVCGMTVYDYCHLGHARVLVVFDVVYRYLRERGFEVEYVRNITDIDDKIINRANENGEPFGELTERFIRAMHEDSQALTGQQRGADEWLQVSTEDDDVIVARRHGVTDWARSRIDPHRCPACSLAADRA